MFSLGLPPCLGHDLFEGVVPFDLAMYISHLVNFYLKILIEENIHVRSTLFPGTPLKPKHNYLVYRPNSTIWASNSTVDPLFWKQALRFQTVCEETTQPQKFVQLTCWKASNIAGILILRPISISIGQRPTHSDRLQIIRSIVDAIRAHCPNPTKAKSSQIDK